MKRKLIYSTWILLFAATAIAAAYVNRVGIQQLGVYLIPTGQLLTPAGDHVEVNDRPLGMVLSPDGQTLIVSTGSNFNPRAIHLIDVASKSIRQSISIGNSFVGIALNKAGTTLYVAGGADNNVKFFQKQPDGSFAANGSVSIPGGSPSGMTLSPDETKLYVALNLLNSVAVLDVKSRTYVQIPVGTYPYTTIASQDGRHVYVSNWGGRRPGPSDTTDGMNPVIVDPRTGIPASGTVSVINTQLGQVEAEVEVGLHPSALALSRDGGHLYVANANSDTVSVIDTAASQVVRTIAVAMKQKAPLGSSPNALAVTADDKTLYVANASNNAIAVVNLTTGNPVPKGFIPTGWYPTAVTLSADERKLFVASGYGFGSIAPKQDPAGRSYADRKGVVSILDVPSTGQLESFTHQVDNNNSVLPANSGHQAVGNNPVPMTLGQKSPIKHVFFVIKENRTYDQVFGDMPQGNGDPSLAIFGRDVTPNHHALAEKYVLMDNFYGPGDQSALGHRWCTQGYASDWVFKYGNARNDQNPMLFAPTDFIWDQMKSAGRTVRSYGERGLNTITPATATWTDIYNDWKNGTSKVKVVPQAVIVGLRDVYSPHGAAFEQRVPDQWRLDQFLTEFREFEQSGNLPELVVLLLSADHTQGTSPGYPTPRASVADNDLAVGRLVEAVSGSQYWKESAIFITEDDSQDGLDHVDGHRTVGLVVSPWVKRGVVDSNFYSIINMYRTMKQILGLAPSNQFDLAAEPMFSLFTSQPDYTPYSALSNRIPLDEMNPSLSGTSGLQRQLAVASLKMDFSEPDAADAGTLNRAIWHSVKGYNTPYGLKPVRR
jgi:YVTN family beta-propeller protein